MRSRLLSVAAIGALSVLIARPALAQLNEKCMVSVLNRTVRANADGSWVLPNVPANFGLVRARATCTVDGATISGESDLFSVPRNGIVNLKPIIFGKSTPIPTSLTINGATQTLAQAGATLPLNVVATYSDGTTRDVTAAAAGTQYTISNRAIATVSSDGLVQAISSGTVIVQATLEGASGLFSMRVALSGADTDGDGVPDDYELSHGLDANNSLDAQEDPDRDGLTNVQEFQLGTDPHNRDVDGDELSDGDEVNVHHTNPFLVDTDGDGIPDGVEVKTSSNPLDRNSYNLQAAADNSLVQPSAFVLSTSALFPSASVLLTWRVTLIDGKTTLDLSANSQTNYSSSNLTVCNFGAEKGRIFAGSPGGCTITLTNHSLSATAVGTVRSFTPTALSSLSIPGFANNVDVAGDFAYVAAGSAGLQVVDVSNRANPSIVASRSLPGNANDVVVVGGYAYVACGNGGLQIVNVQNPLTPVIAGASVATGDVAWDVVVKGNRAYVANGASGLIVIDVSSPAAPSRLGALSLSGTAKGVDVDPVRQIAVVARGTAGLSVINVADPSAPTLLATLAGGDVRDLTISGNYVFLADISRSFTSVDLANPAAPVLRGSTPFTLAGQLQDVAVNGTVGVGADTLFPNGVPLIDTSNPTSPQPRFLLDFSSFRNADGSGIAVDSTYVYLTAGNAIENGVNGTTYLYIGKYRNVEDSAGIPPTIQITSPATGTPIVLGNMTTVTATAADDVAVAAVTFFVNGQFAFTATAAPYQYTFAAPTTGSTFTLGAMATDFGNNVGRAADVVLNLVPDPLTTVTGRVLTEQGATVSGATVTAFSRSAVTRADGTFSIPGVPTILGNVAVTATATIDGVLVTRKSASVAPVVGGMTDVGEIVLGRVYSVTVGIANSRNFYPFMNGSGFPTFHYQQVYSAAAFSGVIQIDSLTFFQDFAAQFGGTTTVVSGNYQISLSTTGRLVGGLSPDLASNTGADSKVFFTGNLGGVSTRPSFTITAAVPFIYDPRAGNLLLDIVVTNQPFISNWGFNDTDDRGTSTSRALFPVGGNTVIDAVGLVTQFNK